MRCVFVCASVCACANYARGQRSFRVRVAADSCASDIRESGQSCRICQAIAACFAYLLVMRAQLETARDESGTRTAFDLRYKMATTAPL